MSTSSITEVSLSSLASGTHATSIGCHPVLLSQQLPLPLKYPQLPLSRRTCHFASQLSFSHWGLAFVLAESERRDSRLLDCGSSISIRALSKCVPYTKNNLAAAAPPPLLGWPSPLLCPNLLKFGLFIHVGGPITELTGGGVTNASAGWNAVQSL